jgi:LCP family protein required for cell wall assembly
MYQEPTINLLKKDSHFEHPDSRPTQRSGWFLLLLGAAILLAGSITVFAFTQSSGDSLEYDPITLEPKEPEGFFKKLSYLVFKKDVNLEGEHKDRINILLLGMGGVGHDGPFLTDTIMIASIQPSTNEIALVSIPRDLGVAIENRGVYKVNHANSFGEVAKSGWGGAYATQIISETFDISIPYYVRLDFTAFEEIIDEVGGVRIDVPNSFTDYQYPGPRNSYQTISFTAGPNTMDGKTALMYARSRHGNNGEGSDFARARRQQQILIALKEKVLSFGTLTNPLRIKKIMDALEKNMTTNMQFDEIIEFARMARELDTNTLRTLVLDTSPNGFLVNASAPGGAFILSPKDGSFDTINHTIQDIFNTSSTPLTSVAGITDPPQEVIKAEAVPTPSSTTPDVPIIEIQNGTWSAGLAARIENRLKSAKIYSEKLGNVNPAHKPISQSGVYTRDPEAQALAADISQILDIPVYSELPDDTPPLLSQSTIVVILGEDFVE